jgi:glycosyltransferase involved in cell wall biosynthesis
MVFTNMIGRVTLWSVTASLVFGTLSGISSALWLLTPLSERDWFLVAHQALLAAFLSCGFLAFLLLFLFHRLFLPPRGTAFRAVNGTRVHVGLTAYNDEQCIGQAVQEFKACPEVHKVIVVENNSRDRTYQVATEAGADEVVTEKVPGYGSCCMRALGEAACGADIVVLCEGDMTFSAQDVKKFLAYLENCDLVVGTRATQELRQTRTQMDWLINPANQIVAKLLQTRFWGTRLTDVGCTFRAMRTDAYLQLRHHLSVCGNHFSPHMIIEALSLRMRVIEIPVVFRRRGGISKGVGSNKFKAARVALRMLALIYRA